MIDVYFCTCAHVDSPIRYYTAMSCWSRWVQMKQAGVIRLNAVMPDNIDRTIAHILNLQADNLIFVDGNTKDFQWKRRTASAHHATGEIYIFAEDDCMPIGPTFVEKGLRAMELNPSFATLSARLLPEPHGYYKDEDGYQIANIIDHPHRTSGGITFTRRDVMRVVLPTITSWYDETKQTQAVRNAGHRVGIISDVYTNHFGAGMSTIWPESYTNEVQVHDIKL